MKKRISSAFVIALVALVVLSGVAFAAYTFWSGTASVTVQESMAVYVDGAWQTTGTYTWVQAINPGESKIKSYIVRNDGTVNLNVTPLVSPPASADGRVTAIWAPSVMTLVLPGVGAQQTFILTIHAAGDAVPGVYGFTTMFTRE